MDGRSSNLLALLTQSSRTEMVWRYGVLVPFDKFGVNPPDSFREFRTGGEWTHAGPITLPLLCSSTK